MKLHVTWVATCLALLSACGGTPLEQPTVQATQEPVGQHESAIYCDPDTGECSRCGDRRCTLIETSVNCWQDCGASCGDGACNGGENTSSCQADCGYCGDNLCRPGESVQSCIQDCGYCGDGVCDSTSETGESCNQDCPCGQTGQPCCGGYFGTCQGMGVCSGGTCRQAYCGHLYESCCQGSCYFPYSCNLTLNRCEY